MAHQLDGVRNYSCQVLAMYMIAHNFTNARKLGDGDRIISLIGYMLLYFKSLKKPKYLFKFCHVMAMCASPTMYINPIPRLTNAFHHSICMMDELFFISLYLCTVGSAGQSLEGCTVSILPRYGYVRLTHNLHEPHAPPNQCIPP